MVQALHLVLNFGITATQSQAHAASHPGFAPTRDVTLGNLFEKQSKEREEGEGEERGRRPASGNANHRAAQGKGGSEETGAAINP